MNDTETTVTAAEPIESFDKFGIFDGYACRILPIILGKIDPKKINDEDTLEDAIQLAFQAARIVLDMRDDYWVGIYPVPQK
jgi:hypothetical protein